MITVFQRFLCNNQLANDKYQILYLVFFSVLIGDTIISYSKKGEIFSFYAVVVNSICSFFAQKHKYIAIFLMKALLVCKDCFSGWISLVLSLFFLSNLSLFSIIVVVFLTMFVSRKIK